MTSDQYNAISRKLRARVDRAHQNWVQHPASSYRKHVYSYTWESWNIRSERLFQYYCDNHVGEW